MNTQTEAERLAKTWHSRITLRQRIELGGDMTKELRRLAAANAELQAEVLEQARIIGMGAERELAAMSRITGLEAANAELQLARTVAGARMAEFEAENTTLAAANAELLEALKEVAAIAHCGGFAGLSEFSALMAVRRATLAYFDTSASTSQNRAAIAKHQGTS